MTYEDLTPEQLEKVHAASSPEEILKIAQDEGYSLSDGELESISGGSWGGDDSVVHCPNCDGTDFVLDHVDQDEDVYRCQACGTLVRV